MRNRSWLLGAVVLGCCVAVIAGCGTKSQPESGDPQTKVETNAATASALAQATAVPELVKLIHEMDPAKHNVQGGDVRATVGGTTFAMESSIDGENLVFRPVRTVAPSSEREFRLKLGSFTDPHSFDNRKLTIRPDMPPGPDLPEILVRSPNPKSNLTLFPNGYALTLELGTRQGWKIPGKIYLCLPDEEKTVLAGFFNASFPRQPTEPPGPEDLSYVQGTVTVIGAPAMSSVRAGYIDDESPGIFHVGSVDMILGEPMASVGWVRSDNDRPRVSTLLSGGGKNSTLKYEHSKLTTGRYLVFAALEPNGPIAWKWLAVLPNETHTIDLTIDATQTGGIEIGVPLEAVKNVQLAPADKPGYHALDPAMFTACAWQFGMDQPIIARKAVFKNLAPGRYEVRAAGHSRTVEIVAGKTIELEFDKVFTVPSKPEPAPEPRAKQ